MSLTGHPSVAVPNGFEVNGSPAGVMFSGQLYREGELMALARAFQDQNRQYEKLPPLFAAS
jgi:Asp-tRNA(Asn)/Glu-tRNA(Gln) amidotransferase A subunit family amidase